MAAVFACGCDDGSSGDPPALGDADITIQVSHEGTKTSVSLSAVVPSDDATLWDSLTLTADGTDVPFTGMTTTIGGDARGYFVELDASFSAGETLAVVLEHATFGLFPIDVIISDDITDYICSPTISGWHAAVVGSTGDSPPITVSWGSTTASNQFVTTLMSFASADAREYPFPSHVCEGYTAAGPVALPVPGFDATWPDVISDMRLGMLVELRVTPQWQLWTTWQDGIVVHAKQYGRGVTKLLGPYPDANLPPVIAGFDVDRVNNYDAGSNYMGGYVDLTPQVTDANEDLLSYEWSVSFTSGGGSLTGEAARTATLVMDSFASGQVTVAIRDGRGGSDTASYSFSPP
jgi:hypothetical protein